MTTPGWMAKLSRPVSLWRTALGWACVCAGIVGIILPVIPGIPLLLAGLVILSARYRWAAVGVRWLRRKVSQVSARRAERKEKVGA
jgi:uncharacterized protein